MVISIVGRRWFQKTYGNTYHTAQIAVSYAGTTRHIHTAREYGYGDSYMQTAQEVLAKLIAENEIPVPAPTYPLTIWARENGIDLHYQAIDVARQKDL